MNRVTLRAGLLAVVGLLYPPLIVAVVFRLRAVGWPDVPVLGPGELRVAELFLAVVALINVAAPWQGRARWAASAEARSDQDVAGRLLLLGFPFDAAPASYGLLLYVLGSPAGPSVYFAGLSLVATAGWVVVVLFHIRGTRS